jgi:Ca-activated chloride channel homolog
MAPFGLMASLFRRTYLAPRAAIQKGLHLNEKRLLSPVWRLFSELSAFYNRKPESSKIVEDTILRMRHPLIFLIIAVAASTAQVPKPPWASGTSSSTPSRGTDSSTNTSSASDIKVDVKLVNVFATVTDDHGAPVTGLTKENFELLEDGKPQKISIFDKESAMPLSIVLGIDTSLSTRKDLPLELNSARRFAHAILRPVDALALFEFSEVVNNVVPFTADLKTIDHGIEHPRLGAATALYDCLYLGSQALDSRQGRKVMVVITDGGDTVSQVDYKEAVRAAQEAEVILYSIIVVPIEADAGRDTGGEHALIQLSEDTGGKYFYATSTPQLDDAFKKISDELRTQYLLAYYPSQRYSGSEYRRIEVKIDGAAPGYSARYRTGYYTTKSKF